MFYSLNFKNEVKFYFTNKFVKMSDLTTQQIIRVLHANVDKVVDITKNSQIYIDILKSRYHHTPDYMVVYDDTCDEPFQSMQHKINIDSGKYVAESRDEMLFLDMFMYFYDDYDKLNDYFDYFKDIVIIPKITTKDEYDKFYRYMNIEYTRIYEKQLIRKYEINCRKNHPTFYEKILDWIKQ